MLGCFCTVRLGPYWPLFLFLFDFFFFFLHIAHMVSFKLPDCTQLNLNRRMTAPKYSFSDNFKVNKCYSSFQDSQARSHSPPIANNKTLQVKVKQKLGFHLRTYLQLSFKVSFPHSGCQ